MLPRADACSHRRLRRIHRLPILRRNPGRRLRRPPGLRLFRRRLPGRCPHPAAGGRGAGGGEEGGGEGAGGVRDGDGWEDTKYVVILFY